MTDRDHFASAALTGLLRHSEGQWLNGRDPMPSPAVRRAMCAFFAAVAYECADAMMERRGEQPAWITEPNRPRTTAPGRE